MLTEDENIVEVSLSVQYTAADPKNFALAVRDPERSLAQATESALRHVVGSTEMHPILTEGRAQVAIDVQERLQRYLDSYDTGIIVSRVTVANTQAPKQVQAAFDDVIKAREDEERVKNEAQTYANGIVPEARGAAQRVIEEANGYKDRVVAQAEGESQRFSALLTEYQRAPAVTRERLYLDTMQQVMSNSSKVLMDVEGGNNLMYLPLDKMMNSSPNNAKSVSLTDSDLRKISDNLRRQSASNSGGDVRTSNRGGR
jgi:membrane protease subunit HflK